MQGPPSRGPESAPQSMSADNPVKPGDVLSGKFRVERVLGVGGMGVVVAATHLQLGQRVALKFMLPAALQHPDSIARFEREARAAVRLRSDHVAKVTDVGRLDSEDGLAGGGAPYMVMEFLEGDDLDNYARKNAPMPIQSAVDFVLQACEAIAEAHSIGIVHRDLKPKNLFLTHRLNGEPLVKVLDFGVSKMAGEGDLSLTGTTQILGSPSYMSPEQLRASRDVDPRTDIWALGTILYELLTGSVPFPATSITQLTVMVISEPPRPIESLRQDVPPALRETILRCLQKQPEDRFQSVAEFAAALAPFSSPGSVALATLRMGEASASASGAYAPAKQSGPLRVSGSSTDVAWNRTELAPNEKPSQRKPMTLVIGVASVALIAAGAVVFRHHGAGPAAARSAETTPVQTTMVTAPTTPTAREPAASPSETATSPVVSGEPQNAKPQSPHHVSSSHVAAPPNHDAGVRTKSSNEGDLPNTRN